MPAIVSPLVPAPDNSTMIVQEIKAPAPKEIKSEDYMPITDSKNVEKFINDYFEDIPLMKQIAKCESRYRQYGSNGEVLKGEQNRLDRGVMQINLHYHGETAAKLGLDVHNIDDNVAYARYLYEKQGSKPWNSSSPCWGKYVGSEIARK